jgi:hypothetical protein
VRGHNPVFKRAATLNHGGLSNGLAHHLLEKARWAPSTCLTCDAFALKGLEDFMIEYEGEIRERKRPIHGFVAFQVQGRD